MTGRDGKCTAKRRDGSPCNANAITGHHVCWHHGGASPWTQARAAENIANAQAERTLNELAVNAVPFTSIREVYDELLALAGVSRLWREILQERVSQLSRLGYEGITGEQVKADVLLFERAITRSAKINSEIARLNLEERKQALDERLAQQIYGAVTAILGDLHLTEEQQELVKTVVPTRMRELVS